MSKFRFDLKAKEFRAEQERALLQMAMFAVNQSKVKAFDTESWNGRKWARRKDGVKTGIIKSSWAGQVATADTGRRLLVKTGRMRNSIGILHRTKRSITWGSAVPYAKYHNEGTKHLPKRQFIGMTTEMKRYNAQVLRNYLRNTKQKGRAVLR
jgi:phage gpG-like protein